MAAQQEPTYTIRVTSELVQISVVVRDRNGRFVDDLTKDDFSITEDGRRQQLTAVDQESIAAGSDVLDTQAQQQLPILTSSASIPARAARDLRLVTLFFDFTSLAPDQAARSLRAAEAYVQTIGPADRVAIVDFADALEVQQDFTSDQEALRKALQRLRGLSRAVIEAAPNADPASYMAFMHYRRLHCLRQLVSALARVPQKKSVVIFAGTGGPDIDLAGVTATINAAVRADVIFYGVDAAGLAAVPPLGDAARASSYGTEVLSGTAVAQGVGAIRDQQLLYALARGTGGRAFFESNDFDRPFRALESDTREYYLLSYRSSNTRHDGKFRHVSVHVGREGIKLAFQAGYYGPHDAAPMSGEDVERVLATQLSSDLPSTSLPVLGFVSHLRVEKNLYYVPITVTVPVEGFFNNGTASSAAVGIAITDSGGHLVRKLRDVIPADTVAQHPNIPVRYESAAELPAGEYILRAAVVQKSNGQVGSFSTRLHLERSDHRRLSVSPPLSGTLTPAVPSSPPSPLVVNGMRLTIRPLADFPLESDFTIQYQVECGTGNTQRGDPSCDPKQTRSSLQCFSSDQPVFNVAPPASAVSVDAAVFRVQFPAGSLPPGSYTCRVTAINAQVNAFAFGATQLRIFAGAQGQAAGSTMRNSDH